MKLRLLLTAVGVLGFALGACSATPDAEVESIGTQRQLLPKSDPRKIYVHHMPWFETPGFHWDMVGRHYNPQIGPYHSGDYKVIEYQLLLMKYSGIDGLIIDWPGKSTMHNDLPANAENTDQIVDQTAKFGLEFAVCFEDQYASDTNDAINSMHWARDHYFNRPNHIKYNGQPALFVFGPQRIAVGDWPAVLGATGTDPSFFTLWYNDKAGGTRDGTYAWIYKDGIEGVRNYYNRADQGIKVPVIYPGFNAAYPDGAPGWGVGYDVEGDTFTTLYNASKGVGDFVQLATWNDYTEGTMIEPTNEFGYKYLTKLQQLLGVGYGQAELEIIRKLYDARKANDPNAEAASTAIINGDFAGACAKLNCNAPKPVGTAGSGSGNATAGTSSSAAGTSNNNSSGGSNANGTAGTTTTTNPSGGNATTAGGSGVSPDDDEDEGSSGGGRGCSFQAPVATSSYGLWVTAFVLAAARRRRKQTA